MMQFVKQGGLERIPKKIIVEVFYMTPVQRIADTTFGNETVNVGIPF